MEQFMIGISLAPLQWSSVGAAILCGAIVGLERQLRGKPVGVRTSTLICLGTYVFVALGMALPGENIDSSRILGQVVSGVGFLGAGVIMARKGIVVGVTSAATVWILAAIGCLVGVGFPAPAIAIALICVGLLVGVEKLEMTFRWLQKGVHAHKRQ